MTGQDLFVPGTQAMNRKPTKTRRPSLTPQTLEGEPRLSETDWFCLEQISDYGGMLPTYLAALLCWGKNVGDMLYYWLQDKALKQRWLQTHSEHYLWEKVEGLKFLRRVRQVWMLTTISRVNDMQWWQWLEQLHAETPELWNELQQSVQGLHELIQAELANDASAATQSGRQWERQAAKVWLVRAVEQNATLPTAFYRRPQHQHEIVSSWAWSRLQYLMDAELTEPYQPPRTLGKAQTCWYLTRRGRNLLANRRGVSVKEVNWKPVGSYATTRLDDISKLEHRLGQSEFRFALTRSIQANNGQILQWLDTMYLERILNAVSVSLDKRRHNAEAGVMELVSEEHRVKIPDDFVWILTERGQVQPLVIEWDNNRMTVESTKTSNTMAMKYRTWSAFCQGGLLKEYFPDCDTGCWHLTVTTGGEERLRHLQDACMDVVGRDNPARDRYWFGLMADMQPSWRTPFKHSVFQKPVWLRGDNPDWQRMSLQ